MLDKELLELIATQVGRLTDDMQDMKTDVHGLKTDMQGMKADMQDMKAEMQGVKTDVQGLKTDMQEVKTDVQGLKGEVADLKKIVIRIENDHGAKLNALFDGYKQNCDRLIRIEEEVKRHDEFILRRVK